MTYNHIFALLSISIFTSTASASMRCGTGLVEVGDKMELVQHKCGQPNRAQSEGPAMRNNGIPQKGAAKITIWVYGPNGGSYRYLRFIDENLVDIQLRRSAPEESLFRSSH
jgi:hypothetical protein